MQISRIFTKKKAKGDPAGLGLKIFLASSFLLLLIFSHFTALTVYSSILDIMEGNHTLTFLIPDFILLFSAFFWLDAMLILSLRHLKNKRDWLYIYGTSSVVALFIFYLLY